MNPLGQLGEQIARKHLEEQDYLFVEANYQTRFGELDLIMRDSGGLVFVEVKTRQENNLIAPNDDLTDEKLEKMEATIEAYLEEQEREEDWRGILIGVSLLPNGMAKIREVEL